VDTAGGTTQSLDIRGKVDEASVIAPKGFPLEKASLRKAGDPVQLVTADDVVLASTAVKTDGTYAFSDSSASKTDIAKLNENESIYIVSGSVKTIVTRVNGLNYKGLTGADLNKATTAIVSKVKQEYTTLLSDFRKNGTTSTVSDNDKKIAFREARKRGIEYKEDVVDKTSSMLTKIAAVDSTDTTVNASVQKYYDKVIAGNTDEAAEQMKEVAAVTLELENKLAKSDSPTTLGSDVANFLGQITSSALTNYEMKSTGLYQGYLIDSVSRKPISEANIIFSMASVRLYL
jgi:hypothetical protein